MKRREKDDGRAPRWLLEPSPADWPEPVCHWECAYWQAANEWSAAHPDLEAGRRSSGRTPRFTGS